MKLLFFASDYRIGLSDLLVEELKSLVRQPEMDLIAIAGDQDQSIGLSNQVAIHRIPIRRIPGLDEHRKFLSLSQEIYKTIKSENSEYVHVQNNWQLALVIFIKFRYREKLRIIYTIHGYRHNQYFKSLLAKTLIDISLFLFADLVFAPTSYVRKKFPFVRYKSHLMFLGVEERYFNAKLPDFSKQHKNLIFAGQFRHGKNQKIIIDAVSKYLKKSSNVDFTLYLPGDGPLKAESIEHVKKIGLKDNVVFTGQLTRDEIFDLYNRCQIAIIPTNYETFGHCIAEPFVLGLCVITRKVGIAADIINDPVNGLIFEDEYDLALLFEKYLNNCESLERIGQNAYEMRDILRWDLISSRYSEILKNRFGEKLN